MNYTEVKNFTDSDTDGSITVVMDTTPPAGRLVCVARYCNIATQTGFDADAAETTRNCRVFSRTVDGVENSFVLTSGTTSGIFNVTAYSLPACDFFEGATAADTGLVTSLAVGPTGNSDDDAFAVSGIDWQSTNGGGIAATGFTVDHSTTLSAAASRPITVAEAVSTTWSWTTAKACGAVLAVYNAAAGGQTITLTPVTRKMVVVAPTLAGSGQASVAPAPVPRAQVVQAPTLAGSGSASVAPNPVTRSQVVVAPTVAATGGISVTPAPVTRRQQVVAPAVAGTGQALITLSPVSRRHIVVAPALAGSGSADIAPVPVPRRMLLVAPVVSIVTNVTLTAIARRMQVVAPVISPTGTATIALTPVARRMLPVAPVVAGTGVALILLIPVSRSMVLVAPVVAVAIATGVISLEGLSDSVISLEGLFK